ncbi:MAG: Phosphoglucosamine mutase [bacterium ADurb.Bin270]|nr:phosphoglucosamine mutase [Myxococcales bacterium]OQA59226.1 MAG: Phosphoglucosamine mutase [bacterium ADurb.Bin270]
MYHNGRKLFGTDGVRGIANSYPMDSCTAVKLGQAIANHFCNAAGLKRIVIGKDTRLSGYVFESALVAGICSMGVDAMLVGPLPTPGIAFIAHSMRARAGVMVSASHNPVEYNGIKFFDNQGFKLPDETEFNMERMIFSGDLDRLRVPPLEMGKAYRIDDAGGRYIQYIKGTFPTQLTLDGFNIVLDCANGAGYKVAPTIFSELGARVHAIFNQPNGLNINVDCGALHPAKMCRIVREQGADVGIALDGDADRVIMCDENGALVDGDALIAICAFHLHSKGSLAKDTVVGTTMSNMGLEISLARKGIKLLRTDVGDRYIMEVMRSGGYNLGGENSGHVIFLHHTTSGDGILAALRVLSIMRQNGKRLSELVAESFKPFPQKIINVPVREKVPFEGMKGVAAEIKKTEETLGKHGRLLVRYSGTENIARVMVEGENESQIGDLVAAIADAINAEIGLEG